MKHTTKVMALVLAFLMMLAVLAACNTPNTGDGEQSTQGAQTEQSTQGGSEEQTTGEQSKGDKQVYTVEVKSVGGMGLMVGIETVAPAADVVKACMVRGVLCLTAKHKVRLLPALNIPDDVLAEAINTIADVCAELAKNM